MPLKPAVHDSDKPDEMKAVNVTAVELLKLKKCSQLLPGTSDVVTTTWSLKPVTEPVTLLYTVRHYTVTLTGTRSCAAGIYTRHIRRLKITLQAMPLVVQNFCDISTSSLHGAVRLCPQRPVIHHERVTPVSLDRKVTVRLSEDAASSQA